jgi:hypothetical protein
MSCEWNEGDAARKRGGGGRLYGGQENIINDEHLRLDETML